jgi:hypothetical protein
VFTDSVSRSGFAQATEERRFLLGVGTLRPPRPSEEVDGEGGLSQLFQAIGTTALHMLPDTGILLDRQSAEKK